MNVVFTKNQAVLHFAKIQLEGLVFIDIHLNGRTYPFLFDTGASISVVNDQVASEAGLILQKQTAKGWGNAGQPMETKIGIAQHLGVGCLAVSDLKVAVLPVQNLTFTLEEGQEPLVINGFLGWDVIRCARWTINNDEKTLTVEKSIPFKCSRNLSHDVMPTLKTRVNGEKLRFGFDSGNTESTLGKGMLERLKPEHKKMDSFTGVDGTLEMEVYDVDLFQFKILGKEVQLKHVPILNRDVYVSKRGENMGLLASDIVKGRNWVVDYPNLHFEILASSMVRAVHPAKK